MYLQRNLPLNSLPEGNLTTSLGADQQPRTVKMINKIRVYALCLMCLLSHLILFSNELDLQTIKKRVVSSILDPVSNNDVEKILSSIKDNGTWPEIDYSDVSREGFLHRFHASNILTLAKSYRTDSSRFFKKPQVKNTIIKALKHWADNDYICDNWWYNQIGIPDLMVRICLLMNDDLPSDLINELQPIINRANVNAQGARPGGDRVKIAGIEAKNMLFLDNHENFKHVIKVIENEIKRVPWIGDTFGYGFRDGEGGFGSREANGRGIQYDNSFHHRGDGVNNTLSYGLGYASAFIEWAVFVDDTQYSFSNSKIEELTDYFLDGICKTSIYGKFPDPGAKNRSMSRPGSLKPFNPDMPEKLLSLSDYRKKELRSIINLRQDKKGDIISHATYFRHSEHFTFQRPNFFTSVRMYSTRVHNMEEPYNSEGLMNHYRGDGANHISISGDEYFDIWPVYDYRKIPGATIAQNDKMPTPKEITKLGHTDFVGAVTDGTYGAVAFDFKTLSDTLTARKSWFFFDTEFVCLGAGISADNDSDKIVTTLNQTLLRSQPAVFSNNTLLELKPGIEKIDNTSWVFQDGIGYVFPKPTTVYVKNQQESGSWWRINKQVTSSKEQISKDVFAIWLDHGAKPKNLSYQYIVKPATTIDNLKNSDINEAISILSNTPYLQAVKNNDLGIYQVVFYKGGTIKLNEYLELTSTTPGIVMLKIDGNNINQISVSDPNRELLQMQLTVSAKINEQGEHFSAKWEKREKQSHIKINMPVGVDAGSTVTLQL
ncbi:chondroitin lyase [Euzebyella marina]|uniref:Chondroitin lyase n=2 Tax=Euzebyella marina TaxID=1761453 RepID=A0A3G2LB36_9FLAO|nr:chondroitin lyase [Euzebyella marina]